MTMSANHTVTAPAPGAKSPGRVLFPHVLSLAVDNDLQRALEIAARIEREPLAAVARRWLRYGARHSGVYQEQEATNVG